MTRRAANYRVDLSLRRPTIDAIVRTGGKQYRVHEGSKLRVATIDAEPGSRIELRDVLLVSDGDKISVGSPAVEDAVVVAEVVEHGRGKKVISFKFKAKTRYRRKRGHRQAFTELTVREVRIGPAAPSAPAPRRRASAAARQEPAAEAEAPPEEPVATVETEAAEPPPTPSPRRRRRTAAAEQAEEASPEQSEPAAPEETKQE